MKISTAKTKLSKKWRTVDLSWPQLVQKIANVYRTPESVREYKTMSREDRDRAKGCMGGFVGGSLSCGQRKTENVVDRCLITLDADNAVPGAWDTASVLVENRMLCYSTHSHTAESPRLRWVLPTSRPMTPEEYPAVARKVATWLDIETMDPTTYEVARLMYWPTCSMDGEYEFHSQEGPVLDVDRVLASYGYNDAWKDSSLWPTAKAEAEVRLHAMKKAGEPTEKPGVVGLFCRVYDVPAVIDTFLSDVYTETAAADRYTYNKGSTAGGAIVYNDGAFLYSNHATDPAGGGQCCNAFDLVRIHNFGILDEDTPEDTPVNKRPSYTAMCEWAAELPEIKEARVQEKMAEMEDEFGDLIEAAARDSEKNEGPAAAKSGGREWSSRLELNNKTGECEPTINNALLILMNDPALKGKFGYDQFREEPRIRGDVPWRPKGSVHEGETELWSDLDEAGVRHYLQKTWKFKSENDLKNALELAFDRNAFHPVREYLESLEWDGTERVDTMLIRHLGAEDTPLNRAMTRKWMCGAVARVMVPGCKFDQLLVILGRQGLGKSSFADILARGWFSDSTINMNTKEGYDTLHGVWIHELPELASVKRSDVETVKSFLSARVDRYRKAYARRAGEYPRQCVFFGTTNEPEFLRDRSGNRRFWPVTATKPLAFNALRGEVDQLWAETYQLWKKGEPLWLDDQSLLEELDRVQDERTAEDEVESAILTYLDTLLPGNWEERSPEDRRDFIQGNTVDDESCCRLLRGRVCVAEVRTELFRGDRLSGTTDYQTSRRISNTLGHLPGWEKIGKQKFPGYGVQWCYQRLSVRGQYGEDPGRAPRLYDPSKARPNPAKTAVGTETKPAVPEWMM